MRPSQKAKALIGKAQAEFKAGRYAYASKYLQQAKSILCAAGQWESKPEIAAHTEALIRIMNEQAGAAS
jgi:hypothetical protein